MKKAISYQLHETMIWFQKVFFFWKLLCVQDCISYPEIQMLLVRNQPEQLDLTETQKLRLK